MTGWAFYVLGRPAPQGSKSFKGFSKAGRPILTESSKAVRPWREAVLASAPTIPKPLDGPLMVWMVFTMPRPQAARKRDTVPFTQPDLSKLCRATEDAVTDAGLWVDDARVAGYVRLEKVWPGYDRDALPVPGAVVAAVEREGDWWDLLKAGADAARDQAADRIRGAPLATLLG